MAGTLVYDASSGRYQYVIGSGSAASSAKAVKKVRTIQEMLALSDYSVDVMVLRAYEGDATVGDGWAIYTYVAEQADNPDTINGWVKVAEEESMDLKVDLSSLGFTYAAEAYNSAAKNNHIHVTDGNFNYGTVIYACAPSSVSFTAFNQISLPEGVTSVSNFKANYYDATYIGSDGVPYLIECSGFTNSAKTFTGESINLNADLTDATTAITTATAMTVSPDLVSVIADGKLFVKPLYTRTSTGVDKAGNWLGYVYNDDGTYSTVKPSVYAWNQVGTESNWEQIGSLNQCSLAIRGDGAGGHILYAVGANGCYQLGSAAYPNTTDLEQVAPVAHDTNAVNKAAAIFGVTPYFVNEPKPITVIENGARIIPNDWLDFSLGGYHVMARRSTGTVEFNGQTVNKGILYVWGSSLDGCLGNGVSYGTGHDISSAELVEKYGFPAGTQPGQIGEPEPTPLAVRVYSADGETYEDVVYDDWIDYDAGWYHNVALRVNEAGETEVYVWGSNEYGVAGNGNYNDLRLQPDGSYTTDPDGFEIITRPRLLTRDEFAYGDIVNVEANHYATIITRSNGDVYYSGCNKRNQLGITNATSDSVNLATFTKMSTFFNGATWDGETYGGFIVRQIPYLSDSADSLFVSLFQNELALDRLATATINQHAHTVSTEDIDSVILTAKPFFSSYETVIANLHSNPSSGLHTNMDVLNGLSSAGNTLLFNGQPIQGGSSEGSGTAVYVDLSNKILDDTADVSGLNNLAGGLGLEVMSYYRDDTNGKYLIRVCPNGGQYHPKSRWHSVGYLNASGTYTELVTREMLQKGLYAIPGTITASAKLLNSTADLNTVMTTAISKSTYVNLYYLDRESSSAAWTTGTLALQVTAAQLKAGTLVYKVSDDQTYYLPLNQVPGTNINTHYDETEQWINLYTSDSTHTQVLDAETAESAGYVYSDGTVVPCAADICQPKSYDAEGNPTYLAVMSADQATTIIDVDTIANGLVKKEGTSYNAVTTRDYPEVFDESLFESGAIYIMPSKNDFTGPANQKYVFTKGQCTFLYGTTANSDGTYPLESVLIPLSLPITSDTESTTAETFMPGSIEDPMMAVVASRYRGYTSSVSGEYNSAIGYNSSVSGNNNDVFGDFSMAAGVANTVTADSSVAFGYSNTVAAQASFTIGTANKVGGSGNFVVGNNNITSNYYGVAIGTANKLSGISITAIGAMNEVYGSRAITFGMRNKIYEKASDTIVMGTNIETSAKKAFVIGKNAIVPEDEGTFPDNDTALTLTTATFASGGYDYNGKSNADALVFAMGDGITDNTGDPINVMVYRKWMWKMNPAYFSAATGSSNRKMDPRYKLPVFEWEFAGMLQPSFCKAIPETADSNGNKQFTQSFRNAGRVVTCDAGCEVDGTSGTVELNFDLGYKFKIVGNGAYVSVFNLVRGVSDNGDIAGEVESGWVDGAEGYIVAYGTNSYDWPTDWEWTNESPTDMSGLTADSFALVKLMVIDDVVIATTLKVVTK